MTEQRTLTGDAARCGRVRPRTFVYCHDCETRLLRRERHAHEHALPASKVPFHRRGESDAE